jgi:hypothetical protein
MAKLGGSYCPCKVDIPGYNSHVCPYHDRYLPLKMEQAIADELRCSVPDLETTDMVYINNARLKLQAEYQVEHESQPKPENETVH